MSKRSRVLSAGLFLMMIAAGQASAQVTSGTIVGVATDSSGAVIPNAAITVIHLGTKDTRRTQTNERGEFNIPFVRIGEHSISAETQGFRTQTQTGIVVQVDQTVRVEFVLQVGTI
ncbi:MAG TPA: carboxypeptidase-like regulatory domain-containing protein, partial [Edaphobacter sp.]|nr:carboxypeptidase-like regulatory domain-containing protein [Edaphobacter sp.]